MTDKIRILVVDDHPIVRSGIKAILDMESDIEVIGEATDGEEAVAKALKLVPDIVLLDISMPRMDGLEAAYQLRASNANIKILVLTMHENEEYALKFLKAGVHGYVTKGDTSSKLLTAIRTVYQGEIFLQSDTIKLLVDDYTRISKEYKPNDAADLTRREREILKLIAEGHTNRQIANLIHRSIKTVEMHRTNLMKKLQVHNVTELIKSAIRRGLITI